jgi:hypothetical protein
MQMKFNGFLLTIVTSISHYCFQNCSRTHHPQLHRRDQHMPTLEIQVEQQECDP